MAVFCANYVSFPFSYAQSRRMSPTSHSLHSYALHAQGRQARFRDGRHVGVARAEEGGQRELPHGLDAGLLPRHVAIIMDGNVRWAEKKGLPQAEGHEAGGRTWRDIALLSNAWGIQALTTFFFSTENWARPQAEVSSLMQLFERLLQRDCDEFRRCNIQAHIIGDTTKLPQSLQYVIKEIEQQTAQNSGLKLSIAINYGGRYDVVQAIRQIVVTTQRGTLTQMDVTEQLLDKMLETQWLGEANNVDLVIRTSGDQRLSNFLLWQSAYSEIMFLDQFWPEIDEKQYANCLLDFQKRNRRYGKRCSSSKSQ